MQGVRNLALLATDYDGTLATDSQVDAETWEALKHWRANGRRVVLVTGRELSELRRVCFRLEMFDRVVAEDGGTLYDPAIDKEVPLADGPPASLVEALRAMGVEPLSVGRVVVGAWEPHATTIDRVVRESGLARRISRNKRAIMILPPNVDKASGLRAALAELGVDAAQTVGIGDAENDIPLLCTCALKVAVANAQPALKAVADRVTRFERGAGVRELIDDLLSQGF